MYIYIFVMKKLTNSCNGIPNSSQTTFNVFEVTIFISPSRSQTIFHLLWSTALITVPHKILSYSSLHFWIWLWNNRTNCTFNPTSNRTFERMRHIWFWIKRGKFRFYDRNNHVFQKLIILTSPYIICIKGQLWLC